MLIVMGVGMNYAAKANQPATNHEQAPIESKYHDVSTIQNLAEYKALNHMMAMNHFDPEIVEDTKEKRIILFNNYEGEATYKSIYMKQSNHLKVVDINEGVVLDQVIEPNSGDGGLVFPIVEEAYPMTDLQSLQEYEALAGRLPIEHLAAEIITDDAEKRVVLFSKEGQEQYKSIYMIQTNHLKIVDFSQGLIFNESLDKADLTADTSSEEVVSIPASMEKTLPFPPKKDSSFSNAAYQEMAMIQAKVDMGGLTTQLLEDHERNRILLLIDGHGKAQYKSIYDKHSGDLKIISMRDSIVFNGQM